MANLPCVSSWILLLGFVRIIEIQRTRCIHIVCICKVNIVYAYARLMCLYFMSELLCC